ncbi:hypothetical protein ACHAW6_005878 [Cyclotella cf. meneghiniana]
MKEQPITDLINALQQLGTKVSCVEETGFPPMTIHIERLDVGKTSISGGTINVKGCGTDSIQGNVAFANVMEQMRATVTWASESITVTRDPNVGLTGVSFNCGKIPDASMDAGPMMI